MTESVGGIFFYLHFPIINVVKFFLIACIAKIFSAEQTATGINKSCKIHLHSHFDLTACHFLKVKHVFFNPYIFHDAQL